ncbi:MAG: methyl-accepting chemotaxis protein [Phycisphaeraceae bacterium]|nr:methyl-accepting chemotaxis protein [Phycisphaeraceae bacterium]
MTHLRKRSAARLATCAFAIAACLVTSAAITAGAAPNNDPFLSASSRETSPGAENKAGSAVFTQRASSLGEPGTFTPPTLKPVTRPAFGSAAAKTAPAELHHLDQPSNTLVNALWGVTAITAVAVVLIAFRLGRVRLADGATRRGFTLGSKLTLAFGSLAAIILTVSTMSLDAMHKSETLMIDYEDIVLDANHAADLQLNAYRTRMAMRDFQIDNEQASLDRVTTYAGRAMADIVAFEGALTDPTRRELLAGLRKGFEQYEAAFQQLVSLGDRQTAIVQSQLEPTGARLVALISAIVETAHASGDDATAVAVNEDLDRLFQAQLATLRFLQTNDTHGATEAVSLMNAFISHASELGATLKHPTQKRWLQESIEGARFYTQTVQTLAANGAQLAEIRTARMGPAGIAMLSNADKLHESILERTHDVEKALASNAAFTRNKSITAVTAALAIAIIVSIILIRAITGATNKVLSVLQSVAAGDLTREALKLKSSDEIGELARATDSMNESLKQIMADVSTSAGGVASAATEIAASNEEMSAGLAEQADQVSQVSAATEEMSATSQEVANKSTEGKGVVEQTISRIEEIASEVRASAAAVNSLGQKSEEIGQIISVINDIADQTNLLALNAAIEAARAGEHGRGFAVVADEVRQLAERTTKATEQVGQSIREIQQETTGAVQRMEGGTEKVAAGVEYAKQAGDALSSIVTAAEQQSSATIEIAQSVEQINSVALQSREGAAQAAAAAAQLSAEAEKLQSLVKKFKV